MKKLLPLLCILLLILSGCAAKPSIGPADLTRDEQALLRMFDQDYPSQVFDFTAPEGAAGLIIRRQHLQDGQWVSASYYLHVDGRTGRIAISFDDLANGLHCAILQKGEVESTSSRRDAVSDTTGLFTATEVLRAATEVTLNVEIPLLMQLQKTGHETPLPGASLNHYPDATAFADYDHVYIVTATFTDKPLG